MPITLATELEPLHPFFCEDLIRGENIDIYKVLRPRLRVPIAVGEIYGVKWEMSPLIEQNLIDFARCTVPNVGGITEYMKIAALCETHYCGMIPHFTGPDRRNRAGALPDRDVGDRADGNDQRRPPAWPYLPQAYDFHNGKLWPNERPGLGVTLDTSKLQHGWGIGRSRMRAIQINQRPDGSLTNW
jgi:L-alanine-DL-glutamate epimerase-like enolase superfamily enzyme